MLYARATPWRSALRRPERPASRSSRSATTRTLISTRERRRPLGACTAMGIWAASGAGHTSRDRLDNPLMAGVAGYFNPLELLADRPCSGVQPYAARPGVAPIQVRDPDETKRVIEAITVCLERPETCVHDCAGAGRRWAVRPPNTPPDRRRSGVQAQALGGIGMAMAGVSVATETCGHESPLKFRNTVCVY